ncbi:hypothetical protein ACFLS1_05015 [Verrucomicrobiota bacterium]
MRKLSQKVVSVVKGEELSLDPRHYEANNNVMSGLLRKQKKSAFKSCPGSDSLFIHGIRYANSAAKFWAGLVDEIREDFPDCDRIMLASYSSEILDRKFLFSELSLARSMESLMGVGFQRIMREAIAEMEILGPPGSVEIHLFSEEQEILAGELPLECVDAEIFPFLFVWLLEWAGIPESIWNNELLEGEIEAEDKKRHLEYNVSFRCISEHLSEGLYRRSLTLSL